MIGVDRFQEAFQVAIGDFMGQCASMQHDDLNVCVEELYLRLRLLQQRSSSAGGNRRSLSDVLRGLAESNLTEPHSGACDDGIKNGSGTIGVLLAVALKAPMQSCATSDDGADEGGSVRERTVIASTTSYSSPLASTTLSIFKNVGACVVPVREMGCRCGDLNWYIAGDTASHRRAAVAKERF
jgi:hypothetical protein